MPVYTVWLKLGRAGNRPRRVRGQLLSACWMVAVTTADPFISWILAALVFVWTSSRFWSLAVITESDYSAAGIPMLPSAVGEKRTAIFIVWPTPLLFISTSLLFYLYLAGTGEVVYLAGAIVFDALILATNVKLL